jgi:hypothetical protein
MGFQYAIYWELKYIKLFIKSHWMLQLFFLGSNISLGG